ncbi:MAG: hypothetical protein VYA34_13310 [Myxococcota bacterium]|nr:hypothetical protein [Myxococcota bacterium]
MNRRLVLAWNFLFLLGATPFFGVSFAHAAPETNCSDRSDDDADGMVDCADADCMKTEACKPDGEAENTDLRCSDWIDNDGNGYTDCDDFLCQGPTIKVCKGSWDGGAPVKADASIQSAPAQDNDGERNDLLCSDGIDNDFDGLVDCADPGCANSPEVAICRGSPGMKFSIVGNLAQEYDFVEQKTDTRVTKLQLRSFGPIPLIQDSFYLVSLRAEKTPRLTFAMFQVPVGGGHRININSGGGGLSASLVKSSAKQLLLDPAYYIASAFEQGNGAAVDMEGPVPGVDGGVLNYRVFVAGGSGRSTGNIGGRYYRYDNRNYTYSAGAQLVYNVIGYYSRWDTPFILQPTSTSLSLRFGVKYDQRAGERYPAINTAVVFRWKRLVFEAENYTKRELNWGAWQSASRAEFGILLWPKRLMLGFDVGGFLASEFEQNPDSEAEHELKKIRNELQARVALHYYFWSNIGLVSAMFSEHYYGDQLLGSEAGKTEREMRLVAQFRF